MSLSLSREPHDDPGIHLLAIQLASKRAEEAARRSLGAAITGPSVLVPPIYRTWTAAQAAVLSVSHEIRRG